MSSPSEHISKEEIRDIREEYDRWLRRKGGEESGDPAKCADLLAAYIPTLLDIAACTAAPQLESSAPVPDWEAEAENIVTWLVALPPPRSREELARTIAALARSAYAKGCET